MNSYLAHEFNDMGRKSGTRLRGSEMDNWLLPTALLTYVF